MGEADLLGKTLGHCRVERLIGRGGMGEVYLGQHEGLNRSVAIKILPPYLARDSGFTERFLREARTAAQLEHPNVVQVHDVGQEGETYYLIMQLVEGQGLDRLLKERGISVRDSVAIVKRIAAALGAAHRLGIIHRDVKPSNILISNDGKVKVSDFGLAKELGAGQTISGTGEILGTPHYMSPEQAEGKPADARSDLYSLGATLYRMLTGHPPFGGETPVAIAVRHVREDPRKPSEINAEIPEELDAVVLKLMAKKPEERYATAEDLIRDLDAMKKPGEPTARFAPSPPKRSALVPALVGCAVGAAAVIVLLVFLIAAAQKQ
ncbi:MAG: protein kinase domain-containing protein, partial [Planctomycetota bacterium]